MSGRSVYDAVIVGSGPNGLAAAIALAQAGRSVIVFEAQNTPGGGARTKELTLPGFLHDVCSAIHPLGMSSPFFRSLPLEHYGLEWIHPSVPLAHPLDDGSAILLERSIDATAEHLDLDAAAYRQLMQPLTIDWRKIERAFLGPLRLQPIISHPLALTRFSLASIRSARGLAQRAFRGERARALLAGMSAHSLLPLEQPPSAAVGLVLGILGHTVGWPFPKGGSQALVNALVAYLQTLGGEVITDREVKSLEDLPPSQVVLFDVTPRQLLCIVGDHLPSGYRHRLERYHYGPGSFKMDFALDGPVPWKSADCLRAGTIHLGGTFEEIARSERLVARGEIPEQPYVLLAQQSLFDITRTPQGKHTVWAYCHVPNGSPVDMSERIEKQIERFAPGFRERILARHIAAPAQLEAYNANYVGGDINGGSQDIWQLFTRPTARLDPYSTPARNIYLCSSSTPPGGGVHGMCGYFAAQAVLKRRLQES